MGLTIEQLPNSTQIAYNDYLPWRDVSETRLPFYTKRDTPVSLTNTVNVRWYGAVGTGLVDDSAAIQAAVNAGSSIYVPAGTYLCASAITLKSNVLIYGEGAASILKAASNSQRVFSGSTISGVHIRDIAINGGGQTTNVSTGVRGVIGIYLSGVTDFTISRVKITKCGIVHSGDIQNDAGYGGFGIYIDSLLGSGGQGSIYDCTISDIAGGGNFAGDGIYVGSGNATLTTIVKSVTVQNCHVSTVGRHCYTVAGGGGVSTSRGISIVNCFGEKSALCGVDVETGDNARITDCSFLTCGNDQTYFNPASEYTATYRLLAGVAVDNSDVDTVITGLHAKGCYYGISYGGTTGFVVENSRIESSTTADLFQGLANSPAKGRFTNVVCATDLPVALQFTANNNDLILQGCDFTGTVSLNGTVGTVFSQCFFRKGCQIVAADVSRVTWDGCWFLNYAGKGIYFSANTLNAYDCVVNGCRFLGSGAMTIGIEIQYFTARRWVVTNNEFIGQTTAAIDVTNGENGDYFVTLSGNKFRSCVNGLRVPLTSSLKSANVSNNHFESITGWCLDWQAITFSGTFQSSVIAYNIAGPSCTNGIRIAKSTGDGDFINIIGNNWHTCSGTKSSIDITNASGNSAYNIVT